MKYTRTKMSDTDARVERKRFEHYVTSRGRMDIRNKENWELLHNDKDGTDTQYNQKQVSELRSVGAPLVSMNVIYPIISHNMGLITADPPMGRVVPVNDMDKDKAYLWEKLLDAIWRTSKTRMAFTKFVKEVLTMWYSGLLIEPVSFYNPGIFNLTVSHVPAEELYIDPDARETGLNFRDAEAIYIAKLIPKRKAENIFGFAPDLTKSDNMFYTEMFHRNEEDDNKSVIIRDVYEKKFGYYAVLRTRDGTTIRQVLSPKEFDEYNKQTISNPAEIMNYREGVYVNRRMILGDNIELHNTFLPLTEIPIAIGTADDFNTPYGKSPVEYLREMQKALNKFWQIVYINAALGSNTRFMGAKGSFVDKDAWTKYGAVAGHTYEYNADPELPNGGRPEVIRPEGLNSAFYTMGEQIKAMMEYSSSTFPVAMGDASNAPNNVGGLQSLQSAGTIRTKAIKSRLAQSIGMGLWTTGIQYVGFFADRTGVHRFLDDDETLKEIKFEELFDDYEIPEFDLETSIKTSLPSDRERLLNIMQTMVSQAQDPNVQRIAFEESLSLQDFPVIDKLRKKLDTVADLSNQLQQSSKTIEDLQKLVDTLSTDVLINKEKTLLTKAQGDIDVLKAETKAKYQVAMGKIEQGKEDDGALEEIK
jgi:hypothetical protein